MLRPLAAGCHPLYHARSLRLVAAHVADCSPGVRKVLKSEWEVEAVSPGVADHIALGIAAGAGLVAVH